MVPTTVLPGQGRLRVLNPWGGVYASCLWGWHPGREEAGMPQADSVGWDMPVPVPIACARLGREGGERGGCCAGGRAHVGLCRVPRYGGQCRAGAGSSPGTQPWLGSWGRGGRGGTLGLERAGQKWMGGLGELRQPQDPVSTLGHPRTLCHPGQPVPKMPARLRPEQVALPGCCGESWEGCAVRGCPGYRGRWQGESARGSLTGGSVRKCVRLGVNPVGIL